MVLKSLRVEEGKAVEGRQYDVKAHALQKE